MTVQPTLHEALRRSEERFQLLVENLREYAFYMLTPDGIVASWNKGAERIKGYTAAEIIGRHYSLFFPAHDVRRGRPEAELRIAAERGVYEEQGWRVRKDGSQFWASVVLTALRDDQGELAGFAKLTRDFTERRQVTEELRDTEERFNLFTTAVKDYALLMLDPDGRVTSWNPGATRINGYTADEIIGHHFSRFYPPEDIDAGKPDLELVTAAETGRFEEEGRRVRKDGTIYWAHVVISPLVGEGGRIRGFAKVTRDITERRLAEEQIQEMNRSLERRVAERTAELDATVARLRSVVEEKTVLLQEVHHRVKNNLQIISSLLNLRAAKLPPEVRPDLAEIGDRIRTIARVHDRLSAADNVAAIDARDVIVGLCDDIARSHGIEDRVAFEVDVAPITFDLDTATPVGLLLTELVSNAVKHAFPNGGHGAVSIRGGQRDGWVELRVKDDGVGLPDDFAARRSTGYGILTSLAQQLDGTLDLRADGGTEAVLRFPHRRAPAA